MTVYDFSSGFNLLNQGINSLGEALNNRTNAQGYSGIGAAIQNNDWDGAAARAWAMGNPDLAMKLWGQGYGMKQAQAYASGDGSGTPAPTALQPTTVPDGTKPAAPGAVTSGPPTGASGPRAGFSTSNPFTNTLIGQESGGDPKIVSRTDVDSHGLKLSEGGNPTEIAQGLFQIQNHPGGTWSIYAPKAGVDLAQYPTPASAPPDVQHRVAQQIPIGQWGHDTKVLLQKKFGAFDPKMTLGEVEARFGPAAVTAATGGAGAPGAAAPAAPAPAAAPAAPAAAPAAAQPAAPGTASAAPTAPAAPTQIAQAQPQPLSGPQGPAAPQPLSPPLRPPTAQAYAGIPLNAPEQGVDALARALGTNLPGAPSPQQQATAAANPPGLGDLFRLLTGQPNAPAAGQPPAPAPAPAPGASPGANIPAAYGQPTPTTPTGPAAQLQPLIQALQSGRLTMRELLANPSAFGLPDPRQPAAQPIWQALGAAATSTGRPAGLGPPTAAMGAQAFAGAVAAPGTSTGNAPLPPVRPPPEMTPVSTGPDESQAGRGPGRNALEDARAGRLPGYPENAPFPPVRPPDIGKPFPVAASPPPPPATVPAAVQPRSSRVPTPQGPFGPPKPGDAFSRDFGPGQGQMWGPSGGVMAAGPGGITPNYLGGPTPQGVTPAAIAAAQNAFLRPGPGAAPAALQPGAPTRGGGGLGGALGGALSGLGGGLLNMLSMTPPQGVPGMNTPAQFLQGGMNAPVPAPPWLRQPGQQGAGPGAPGVVPTAQGPGPAAQPAAAGAPGAAAAPVDPIQAQIDAAQARAQAGRRMAAATSFTNPALSKVYLDEADKFQEQANELIKQHTATLIKTGSGAPEPGGELTAEKREQIATEQRTELAKAYGTATSAGGPIGLLKNVQQMKASLANMTTGFGEAQGVLASIGNTLLPLTHDTSTMDRQLFQDLSNQEVLQLAQTLIGQQRLSVREFEALRKGQLDPAQAKPVLETLLNAAADRANMVIDNQNRMVDNYQKTFPRYKDIAEQYRVTDDLRPDKPGYKGTKPTAIGGQGAGAGAGGQAPVPVASPAEAMKLPPGTPIKLPDGRIGTVPGRTQ